MALIRKSLSPVLLVLIFSSMAACQLNGFQLETEQPTPTVFMAQEGWLYVALGDSEARCCGNQTYPDYYAEFIKADLGVDVEVQNLAVYGSTSADLLAQLEDEDVQALLRDAQVVTIVTTINDLLRCEMRDLACVEAQLPVAMENYQKVIDKVLELTIPGQTIIRTQTYDNPLVGHWLSLGIFDERVVVYDQWNQAIRNVADRNNIPIADVYLDFNGPNGDEDAEEKGYIAFDKFHNNEAGALRIAELLRSLGYAPLVP